MKYLKLSYNKHKIINENFVSIQIVKSSSVKVKINILCVRKCAKNKFSAYFTPLNLNFS
jgi:hypothetical protein